MMLLDVDEPHHLALGIPQRAFAECALGVKNFADLDV